LYRTETNDPSGTPVPGSDLVDRELSPEAGQARIAVAMSLIDMVGRRAVAVFLGRDDYQKVEDVHRPLKSRLMLECLPGFVHERDGEIAYAVLLGEHGEVVNPIQTTVTVRGQTRVLLRAGHLFIHFPDERVVVSAEPIPVFDGERFAICVRSNVDSVQFWKQWEQYVRQHNYLRGQAFFADGEIIERTRTYGWDDILLPEKTKDLIRTHVDGFLRNRPRLKALGVKARRGLILSGPPGTGKTLLGKVLADTLDASFMWVSPRHVKNASSFEEIMTVARLVSPVVLFLEDLDLFAEERDGNGWAGLGELMNQLDGAVDNEDIVTIATTNRLDVIEKALRSRPGRFDRVIEFGVMDELCRRKMLEKLLTKAVVCPADMDCLVAATADYTGAQIEELANTLFILTLDRADQQAGGNGHEKVPIDRRLIETALQEVQVERKMRLGFYAA